LLADDSDLELALSGEATLAMDDASTTPDAPTVYVSLWQNNLVGFRAEQTVSWQRTSVPRLRISAARITPCECEAMMPADVAIALAAAADQIAPHETVSRPRVALLRLLGRLDGQLAEVRRLVLAGVCDTQIATDLAAEIARVRADVSRRLAALTETVH
jgi:hypothetical protein